MISVIAKKSISIEQHCNKYGLIFDFHEYSTVGRVCEDALDGGYVQSNTFAEANLLQICLDVVALAAGH